MRSKTVQTTSVGDAFIDHGATCDGKDATTPGCFLDDKQRGRLIDDFRDRVNLASTNYKDALLELKVEELLKKDDDLHWAASLALDLIGGQLVKLAGKALISLKNSGVSKLSSGMNGLYLSDSSVSSRAESMLASLDDKTIESNVKTTFDPIKKGAVNGIKKGLNHEERGKKEHSLSFIDQLKDRCDLGFQQFKSDILGRSDDAQLVVVWEGLHPRHHTVGMYKEALGAKLERFRKSGVADLGRRRVRDRQWHRTDVLRDSRVVWVEHDDGTKSLCYQSQEGDYNPNVIKRGDPGAGDMFGDEDQALEFGARHPREDIRNEGRVPLEFVDVAVARSEQIWGPTPTIPDPVTAHLRAAKGKPHNMFVPQKVATKAPPRVIEPNWDTLPDAFKNTKVQR